MIELLAIWAACFLWVVGFIVGEEEGCPMGVFIIIFAGVFILSPICYVWWMKSIHKESV